MSRRLTSLVIGNAAYTGPSKLKNPRNDAHDIATKLKACGFSVVKKIDCLNVDLDRALKNFKTGWQTAKVPDRDPCARAGLHRDSPVTLPRIP